MKRKKSLAVFNIIHHMNVILELALVLRRLIDFFNQNVACHSWNHTLYSNFVVLWISSHCCMINNSQMELQRDIVWVFI